MTPSRTAIAFCLVLSAACAGAKGDASLDVDSPPAQVEFVALGLEGFSSPFTRETVIRLNAIVGRSLAAIREYDGTIKDVQRAVEGAGASTKDWDAAHTGIARLKILSREAEAARAEMAVAEAELKSSGEKYNDAILAGMVAFVVKVDDELRGAIEELESRLTVD